MTGSSTMTLFLEHNNDSSKCQQRSIDITPFPP
eukprot:CAMPEP_0203673072 /NCGR_PEP_ID=MMETSP0090-20130426/10851_1 /ASSEMBLY_ACC=CAM_ASM_001088 /TAXON_ID=426623 /ORGANISM="Chaetoceros affinis, Strain CCMP159" /LENGTH=32 /DNA_ID= /DNA_START= /DNA_END= /DNA_ORIENTATION=